MTALNGRVELCIELATESTIDAVTADHIDAIFLADPDVLQPAGTYFSVKGITTDRAMTFYTSLGQTFDNQLGHVLVQKLGTPTDLSLGAGGTPFHVADVDDNNWLPGNTGGLILFANVSLGAGTTSLTSSGAFVGPTTLPLEAGKLTITTIR